MAVRSSLVAITMCACVGPPPKEPYVEPDTSVVERALLGSSIDMETTAITGCRVVTHIVGLKDTSSHDAPGIGLERESEVVGCRGQDVSAKAFCIPRAMCETADDEVRSTGGASIRVRLVKPGSVKVTLEVNNLESGAHRTNVRRFDVVPPDSFRLQCMTPALAWGPCEAGVAAVQPLIRVFPILDGKPARSHLLRVNGRAGSSSTSFTTGQSLEPLLGTSPVEPGTYELDIAVGEMHQHASITVR